MMKGGQKFFSLITGFCLISLVSFCQGLPPEDSLVAKDLKPYGRYLLNGQDQLELISSAVHFGVSFEGKDCRVFVSLPGKGDHNYLQYELDGVYQKMIRIEGSSSEPIVIKATSEGSHRLWLYKATEAHTGPIILQKITGKNIAPLTEPEAPLIEFIGNSITCGAAADSSGTPCGTGAYHDHHNAYYAYGPRLAKALRARFVLSSVSGIGIYRNWNSDGPAMPKVYENTDFQENSMQHWNFSLFTPEVVSIALGTNDFSNGDGVKKRLPFDSTTFTNEYVKFVQLVRSKYPKAKLVLLSSPMLNGNARTSLQNCLLAIKDRLDALPLAGTRVQLYFFQPMQAHGCNGHPSVEEHGVLANELFPFFKKLLTEVSN